MLPNFLICDTIICVIIERIKMGTQIYIIRHGMTDSNVRHACLGHKDVPLNKRGIEQLTELRRKFMSVELKAVYASPLKRTMDTAAVLCDKVIPVQELIERDYGIWDDMTFSEIKNLYPKEYSQWQRHWIEYILPNGESAEMVQDRVDYAVNNILKKHFGECIAIVTHLGTARHIISCLLGLTTAQSWLFTLDNCKYAKIEIDDNKAVLSALNL